MILEYVLWTSMPTINRSSAYFSILNAHRQSVARVGPQLPNQSIEEILLLDFNGHSMSI